MEEQEIIVDRRTKPEDKIKFSQMAAYGSGGIIPIALYNATGILIGMMGNISLGLSAFWLGFILIIPRLWEAFSDPIIGHMSDNTRTRWGRRRPFLLIGGILVAIFFVLIWWIPKGDMIRLWFPSDAGFQAFQLVYILITIILFFTAVNIFEIPHGALGMELTTDYHERTRLFSAKSFIGNIFAICTPWMIKLASMDIFSGVGGNEADGMRYLSIIVALIIIPLAIWMFVTLREPGFVKAAKHKKTPFWQDMKVAGTNRNFIMLTLTIFTLAMGFNFVQLLGSYIPVFYVFGGDKDLGFTLLSINGTIWGITAIVAVFPLNWISPKIGKRSTLIISILLMCLAQLSKIVCYNPAYPFLIIIPTALLAAGMLFFFTLGSSMVGDICDEDELKRGYRSEGSFYSIFWWFIKMGSAFAGFVGGALIVFTMFDESQVTRVDALQGSVKELQSEVAYWRDADSLQKTRNLNLSTANFEWISNLKTKGKDALEESKKYASYLDKEILKIENLKDKSDTAYLQRKTAMIVNALSKTKSTINDLEQLQVKLETPGLQSDDSLVKAIISEALPLTYSTKIEKARMTSFELKSHLESKARETNRNQEHYKKINQNMEVVVQGISALSTSTNIDKMNQELSVIKSEFVPLTQQTPYTLLMMRVVEIGLPLLLSIFSIIFLLRYSLTEKRSHEIKELIRKRNEDMPVTTT
jgi:GPH family glycoside/pentoside/hexuronide:cation symporter